MAPLNARAATKAAAVTTAAPIPPSLTDRAYAEIEEMIVTLKLAPGSAISEVDLSAHLGIGRTPIREALQRLAREKLVTIFPRRGMLVSAIDVASQLRLIEVRRELERLIVRAAARRATEPERAAFRTMAGDFETAARANDDVTFMRIDRDFNVLCSQASHNEFASGTMSLLHSLSRRFFYRHYKQVASLPQTAKLHADIARAIAAGDEERAGKASDRLISQIEKFTRSAVNP
ncbi:MAG: GntR family transcriptional regulator [Caldimonas sp.]